MHNRTPTRSGMQPSPPPNLHHPRCRFAGCYLAVCVIAAVTLAALVRPSRAEDASLLGAKHQAMGVICTDCHAEQPPHLKVANTVCLGCHLSQAKLAAKTSQATPNPHAPPHLAAGETQACDDCHHMHKPSEVLCTDCHQSFHFNTK